MDFHTFRGGGGGKKPGTSRGEEGQRILATQQLYLPDPPIELCKHSYNTPLLAVNFI